MRLDRIVAVTITTPGALGEFDSVEGEYPNAADDTTTEHRRWAHVLDGSADARREGEPFHERTAETDFTVRGFSELARADVERVEVVHDGETYHATAVFEPEGARRRFLTIRGRRDA